MDAPRPLEGLALFITGASSGLGSHFARLSARSGARVALAARRLERLQALAQELRAVGAACEAIALDVRDADSVARALAEARERVGGLDVVVNNAGVTSVGAALDQQTADFDEVVSANLRGVWLVATEAARLWRESGRPGAIVNIASILGLRQAAGVAPYAISKAGVVQLTKVLALELARFQIRVNALAPGYVATDMNAEFLESEAGRALVRRIPMRRLGTAEDLDGPFLLLAGEASRYMTGSVIVVDGGQLIGTL